MSHDHTGQYVGMVIGAVLAIVILVAWFLLAELIASARAWFKKARSRLRGESNNSGGKS